MTPEANKILAELPDYIDTERKILLKDSPYQTPAFIFDSNHYGPAILIIGGTHGDEPAGYETALRLFDSFKDSPLQKGKIILIPLANYQAIKNFKRRIPVPEGQDIERGNLNRCYPGNERGLPMERLAYQIQQLAIQYNVKIFIDLHEARYLHLNTPPESEREKGLGQTIIYYPNDASAWILMNLLDQINVTITNPDNKFSGIEQPILNSAAWWAGYELDIAAFTFETSRMLNLDVRINHQTQLVNIILKLNGMR